MLEREAEKLGVREHVVFRGQFVSAGELRQYLQAADIFVTPYLNEAQVTSGALSYAMGAGAAVVSTPYWHAQELLAERAGPLVSVQGSRGAEPHVARALRVADGVAARASRRVRVHSFDGVAADRRRLFRADSHRAATGRKPARRHARAPATASSFARAEPRSLAAHDRRHRHHPARHVQRAGAAHRLLRRRQRARADRGGARRSCAGLGRDAGARHHVLELSALLAGDRRKLSQLHELRPVARACAGVGRLHRPRDLGVGRDRHARGGRRLPAACARDVRARACRTHDELGPRGTAQAILGLASHAGGGAGRRRRCAARSIVWSRSSPSAIATTPPTSGAGSSPRSPTTMPCCRSRCSPPTR